MNADHGNGKQDKLSPDYGAFGDLRAVDTHAVTAFIRGCGLPGVIVLATLASLVAIGWRAGSDANPVAIAIVSGAIVCFGLAALWMVKRDAKTFKEDADQPPESRNVNGDQEQARSVGHRDERGQPH